MQAMHGMLSLGLLVAAFAVIAALAGYVLVRLYLACPASRAVSAQAAGATLAGPAPGPANDAEAAPAGDAYTTQRVTVSASAWPSSGPEATQPVTASAAAASVTR